MCERPVIQGDVYVVGDVHGQFDTLVARLGESGLVADGAWSGGAATLVFIGDFCDRGTGGVAALDLVMRLQEEAPAAGGRVVAMLGNHEMVLLAARRFGGLQTGYGMTFGEHWLMNGGQVADYAALTPRHEEWMAALPAMIVIGERLFQHPDSTIYRAYGATIAEVNAALAALLHGDDLDAWRRLLVMAAERRAFEDHVTGGVRGGAAEAREYLREYGGRQLVHGHTPIPFAVGADPSMVTGPRIYADGLCVNVDGGMFLGGPGFVWRVPPLGTTDPG